jgi:hypothetical protein
MTKSGAEAVKTEVEKIVTNFKESENQEWAFKMWTEGKAINKL